MQDSAFNAAIRDEDCEDGQGMFFVHKEFRVVVCSHFSVEDYEEFLVNALPLNKMQPIVVSENA